MGQGSELCRISSSRLCRSPMLSGSDMICTQELTTSLVKVLMRPMESGSFCRQIRKDVGAAFGEGGRQHNKQGEGYTSAG